MAAELKEARRQVYAAVGNENSLCDLCRPEVEGHVLTLGLLPKEKKTNPSFGIKIRVSLDKVVENASRCSICAWLLLLAQTRQAAIFASFSHADRAKVYMGIENHNIHTFETGRTFTDVGEDTRKLAQIGIYLDPRDVGGKFANKFVHMLQLQRSDANPPHVSDLLDKGELGCVEGFLPFTTRLRPQKADVRLLAYWQDECRAKHGGACSAFGGGLDHPLRLIDIKRRCLISINAAHSKDTWTALSYCWGGPQDHALTSTNIDQYLEEGSIDFALLPKVIQDAVTITAALDEQYIWIDSMCIMQDSAMDKGRVLPVMDRIYEQATVTIVNAATSSVHDPFGMPGISSSGIRRSHEVFEINGTYLTETLDPGYSTYGDGLLNRTAWSTRGWTFQEGYLSQRSIIITEDQIYWQCQKASWCEGGVWERHDDLAIYRHCFGDNVLGALFDNSRRHHWTEIYLSILRNYQSRAFTSEDDRLHGLTGVLRVLRNYGGNEECFWAMPQSRLEPALSFTVTHTSVRRDAKHTELRRDALVSSPFPSWSWLGWTGKTNLDNIRWVLNIGILGLHFYRIKDDGSLSRIDVPQHPPGPFPQNDQRRWTTYPAHTEHIWLKKTHQEVTKQYIPAEVMQDKSLASSLLCFYTSAANLQIEPLGPNNYYNEFAIRLSDGQRSLVGLLPGISKDFDFSSEAKFVIVSAEKERMSRGGRLMVKLLLLEEDERLSGVYRRRALVTNVGEGEWDELENTKWELILLA